MRSAVLALVLLAGCVSPLGSLRTELPLEVASSRIILRSDGNSADDVRRMRSALEKAVPALERWGGLREPVTVYVVPTHDDLETAVRRPGYAWLRAWGRYDEIIFQAPSTWTKRDDVLEQLVLHELTHCLLFQQSASRDTWLEKEIPLWFREGMAVAVAGQASQYPSLEDSALWLLRNRGSDAFKDGEALSESQSSAVYALGYHAFTFLERRYGRERLDALIRTMREGDDFERAFGKAIGVPVERYQRDFENYLRMRAFRGTGRTGPRPTLKRLLDDQRPATGTDDDGQGM